MENKQISQMTNEEILRQQLELLAAVSKDASVEDLPQLTLAMIEVYKCLSNEAQIDFGNKSTSDATAVANKISDYLADALEKISIEKSEFEKLSTYEKAFIEAAIQLKHDDYRNIVKPSLDIDNLLVEAGFFETGGDRYEKLTKFSELLYEALQKMNLAEFKACILPSITLDKKKKQCVVELGFRLLSFHT